ncbi:transposase [Candidatus Poribacteria bacterium]|nr:transposase [Candidatus Poribacteria bacterium]
MNLAKSTYYAYQDKQETFESKYLRIKNKIRKIIKDNPAYGYRRILDELKDNHKILLNHKTLT